jgi:hypothetical protein
VLNVAKHSEFAGVIQDLLDEGWTENKVATILNLHHVMVRRVIERHGIEKYVAFDEGDYNRYKQVNNLDWLAEEDVLSEILHDAFMEDVYILRTTENYKVSQYVKDNFGDLLRYLEVKKCKPLAENIYVECLKCDRSYNLHNFYTKVEKEAFMGLTCKKCRKTINDRFLEQNPLFITNNNMKQRSITRCLPFKNLEAYPFDSCFISGDIKYSFDHFIATNTGHAGSYLENYSPLRRDINSSKNSKNPFEWVESKDNHVKLAFVTEVSRLAYLNRLTPDEYRQFVYWCYDNKRDIDEIKRDQRHSIEIWREAVGKQFPLPRYVYDVGFLNESEVS